MGHSLLFHFLLYGSYFQFENIRNLVVKGTLLPGFLCIHYFYFFGALKGGLLGYRIDMGLALNI